MTAYVLNPDEKDLRKVVTAVRGLTEGRSNAVGEVTLRASQTTTTVTSALCGSDSQIFLTPLTANAAAVLATTYISAVIPGSFTITHASDADVDQTFGYECRG